MRCKEAKYIRFERQNMPESSVDFIWVPWLLIIYPDLSSYCSEVNRFEAGDDVEGELELKLNAQKTREARRELVDRSPRIMSSSIMKNKRKKLRLFVKSDSVSLEYRELQKSLSEYELIEPFTACDYVWEIGSAAEYTQSSKKRLRDLAEAGELGVYRAPPKVSKAEVFLLEELNRLRIKE